MENVKKEIRVRIAPSPTGYPHIGTIYQALFNYAYARKHTGKFLVRIEDTDRSRFVEGAEDVIFASIDWAQLTEDESPRKDGGYGPYRQSERLEIYHKYVQELIDSDNAYFAYYKKADAGVKKDYTAKPVAEVVKDASTPTPPASVAEMPENGDWIVRMRVPLDTSITFRDEIRGDITFESKQVTEQVLLKSDKFPTYHLAVVVDDHLMGITHVVRGEEWISSTPKHVLLYEYFGWEKPLFFHTPDLRNPDKSKLSKRQGHTNVNWYREEGFLPEAMVNYLALLGWTHPEEKEIFSLTEFIEKFDLKDIRAVGPVFDLPKLTWMNQQYIQDVLTDQELLNSIKLFYKDNKDISNLSDKVWNGLLPIIRSRLNTLKEFYPLIKYIFELPTNTLSNYEFETVRLLLDSLSKIDENEWGGNYIYLKMKSIMNERSDKMSLFYKIFTGESKGLPLQEILALLGKDDVINRLEKRLQ